jgi:hypothetical protein
MSGNEFTAGYAASPHTAVTGRSAFIRSRGGHSSTDNAVRSPDPGLTAGVLAGDHDAFLDGGDAIDTADQRLVPGRNPAC